MVNGIKYVRRSAFLIFSIFALLVLEGCFGDRVPTPRTISLSFPAPAGAASLSVNDTQVQEALRVIDVVLSADGLTRDPNPPDQSQPGFIASYTKNDTAGLRIPDNPYVYLRSNCLEITFEEFGIGRAHISAAARRTCDSLQKELAARFGAKRVKVE